MFQVVKFVQDIIWGDKKVGFSHKPADVLICGFQGEKCPGRWNKHILTCFNTRGQWPQIIFFCHYQNKDYVENLDCIVYMILWKLFCADELSWFFKVLRKVELLYDGSTHTCMHARTHTCMHEHTDVHTRIHVHVCSHTLINVIIYRKC